VLLVFREESVVLFGPSKTLFVLLVGCEKRKLVEIDVDFFLRRYSSFQVLLDIELRVCE